MYELKKIGKVFTSKFVGTGPSSYKKSIYRAAVSQRLRDTALVGVGQSIHLNFRDGVHLRNIHILRYIKEAMKNKRGSAVTQWLRYCATNRKVAGSIPAGVIRIFQ